MTPFNANDLLKLRELLEEGGESAAARPPTVAAAPCARVAVTRCTRNGPGAPSSPENEVWGAGRLRAFRLEDCESADRTLPDHELLQRQSLEAGDVLRGLGGAAAVDCPELLLRVRLPGARLSELWLESDGECVWVQSFDHSLLFHVPCAFDGHAVRSSWAADRAELQVVIPKRPFPGG